MNTAKKLVNGKGLIMKKALVCLLLVTGIAQAQVNMHMPVSCMSKTEVAQYLKGFNEQPVAIAEITRKIEDVGQTNVILLFVNPNTSTWTIVEKPSGELYCIVLGGSNFNVVP